MNPEKIKAAIEAIVKDADLDMIDAVERLVVTYMGHRRHETEDQTRAAIAADKELAASHARKVQRATFALVAAGFDIRKAPAVPSTPKG